MAMTPLKNEDKNPTNKADISIDPVPSVVNFNNCSPETVSIIGIPAIKAYRAADSFDNPVIIPEMIVIPDREVPRINASAWPAPMISAFVAVKSPSFLLPGVNFPIKSIMKPMQMSMKITTSVFLKYWSMLSENSDPMIPAGIVVMSIFRAKV